MIKQKQKIILILLTIMMVLSLTACGSGDTDTDKADNGKAKSAPVTDAKEKSATDEETLRAMAIEYDNGTIGVQTGSIFDQIVNQYIPGATVKYFNASSDLALALEKGKIDAYVADEPIAKLLCQSYTDEYITGVIESCPYAFVFPKGKEKSKILQNQMNEFLKKIKSDGTLDEIGEIWFGKDEERKVVDLSKLNGKNGTLKFAMAAVVGPPFAYIKDNEHAGYDLDLAVHFCEEYGYKMDIIDYNIGGFFTAVSSGVVDFGASAVCVTEERKEEMYFSDSTYEGNVVLVTRDRKETEIGQVSEESEFDSLTGKNIGIIKGSISGEPLEKTVMNCYIIEYDSFEELGSALENGNIDAYVGDQPLVRQMLPKYQNHHVLGVLEKSKNAFIFQKNNQVSDNLRAQMDEFIRKIKKDGTLEEIDGIWFGDDESKKHIDYDQLTGGKGTISVAVSTKVGDPFMYYKDGNICGYDADIIFRFCREYGYNVKFVDRDFADIFDLVRSGKCQIGASCIIITDERKKDFNFSVPVYDGGTVAVIKKTDEFDMSELSDSSKTDELAGKKIGYLKGSVHDKVAKENLKNPQLVAYKTSSKISNALEKGEIDAYLMDQPVARKQVIQYENHHVHSVITQDNYAYAFRKNDEENALLRNQMNEFLRDMKASGELDKIDDIWFGNNVSLQTTGISELKGENGTINMAVTSSIGAPFCYKKDGEYLGYDIDIAVRFCKKYGYGLKISDCSVIGAALNSVKKGKSDFAGSCITITDEREKDVTFSDSNYFGGVVAISIGTEDQNVFKMPNIFKSLRNSFNKTFVRENRWIMFARGLGATVLMTVMSTILGTLLGFALFMLYRKNKRVANKIIDVVSAFLLMTPVVVVLMIFYYLILAHAGISGVAVSIFAFSIMFACSVVSLFKAAVNTVDPGQTDAVRSLGYHDTKGFLRMILPQAIPHFMEGYKGEIVKLIENTAIVGFVAVQDLTAVTDIIRARTYDAFFPLIFTAIIYFLFALLLIKLIERVEINIDPCNRKESTILKGVNRK